MSVTVLPNVINNVAEALAVIDDLRRRVEAGEIKAFIAVGITPDKNTEAWSSATAFTARLEMMGAIAHLQQCYHSGEF